MIVTLNKVQAFTFITDFMSLNNIYKVTHEMDYNELLASRIDMVASLYSLVDKTAEDWSNDVGNYINDTFYKLESVDNSLSPDSIYVPTSIISTYPDPEVAEYNSIMLLLDLGVFANPTLISSIKTKIIEVVGDEAGIVVDPILSVYDKTWMTTNAYHTVEQNREAAKAEIVNLYSENLKLQNQLSQQQARVAALEEIIITNSL